MARFAGDSQLGRVAEASAARLKNWNEGRYLVDSTSRTLDELFERACADRLAFAYEHRRRADKLLALGIRFNRDAISRYYYSIYHAARSVAFFHHHGDDHQEHSKLPDKLPTNLPDHDSWTNRLKNARVIRNEADYNPYPKSDANWTSSALELKDTAHEFLPVVRRYLSDRGCRYL